MKSVLGIFWELVLAITGAVALSALMVAGGAVALGVLAFGSAVTFRNLRQRIKQKGQGPD